MGASTAVYAIDDPNKPETAEQELKRKQKRARAKNIMLTKMIITFFISILNYVIAEFVQD